MHVEVLKQEDLLHEFEIRIPGTEIGQRRDAILMKEGAKISLPGFRKGKVPLKLLQDRYGQAVLADVLEEAVNDSMKKLMEEKELRPAMQPKIEVKEFEDGKDLVFTAAVETLPNFEIMDLKTISLERPVSKVEETEITETLERIAQDNRDSEPAPEGHKAQNGDIVVIDFRGRTKADGKEHSGMQAEGHQLELGSGMFIDGYEEQLVGAAVGDTVEVNVTFPDPYASAELAGQEAIFDVDIKDILVPKERTIDDELAEALGFEDLEALRKTVTEQLQAQYDQMSRAKVKRALLDRLDEAHDFPVPPGMLDSEYQGIVREAAGSSQDPEADPESALSDEDKEEFKAIAGRRVRLGMILSQIGQSNNVSLGDAEIQQAVMAKAREFPGQEAQVFEMYRNTPALLDQVRASLFEEKTVDFVLELASVTDQEVSIEDLRSDDGEESYLKKDKKKEGAKKTKSSAKKAPAKKSTAKKPAAKKTAKKKDSDA